MHKTIKKLTTKALSLASPANQLKPFKSLSLNTSSKNFEWVSTGNAPLFSLLKTLQLPGWYMLEVAISHNQPSAAACLYLDMGEGEEATQRIYLPLKSDRIAKRLFFVGKRPKSIRFQPMDTAGEFSVTHFRIAWLNPWFAHDRLAQRLVNMHHRWRDVPKARLLAQLKCEAKQAGRHWREWALEQYDDTFSRISTDNNYRQWLATHQGTAAGDATVRLQHHPLISVLLPTYNTPLQWLRECIDSVLTQSYPHWQLCIADDASTDAAVHRLLTDAAARDARVRLDFRPHNGHICAASNSALAMAEGEFIALLDHDDRLAPHALMQVAKALQEHPQALVLYSDEDKLDESGERYDPHFKPDWNPDLLLAQNYISHLGIYRTSLVRELGGFREGTEGSQDHDLVLRCTAHARPEQIVHIPQVLYHWRAIAGSTALDSNQKGYTGQAGLRLIQDYLDSHAPGALVAPGLRSNTYRVNWPLAEPAPLVSLLIPTRDGVEILKPCVDAILERTDYPNLELLILDNQSTCRLTLDYMEQVARDPRVRVLHWDHPFNYSAINNFGATQARGELIGLVNNDIEPINSGWLREMVSQALRPGIGCVGAKLYYPNDTVQHGGVILGIGGVAGHAHKYFSRNDPGYFSRLLLVQNMSAVTGACLLVRKTVFEQVGGLTEALAVAFNDVDFCLKVREAGYRNLWTPYAELYHHESVSRGADNTSKKRARARGEADYMRKKWGPLLDRDPAYNPNLTLVHEDFSLG